MSLRSYVEILLKQVVEDISNQFHRTNEQFRNRMEEMRYMKIKLEGLHCGTANQVRELERCNKVATRLSIEWKVYFY